MNSSAARPMTLVFPAVGQAATDYVQRARARGEGVVCAALPGAGDELALGQEVHPLPSIYDPEFAASLQRLLADFAPNRIFSSVAAVYRFLRKFIAEQGLELEMVGESPIAQEMQHHHALMARARRLLPLIDACAEPSVAASITDVAGILRTTSIVYGESNDEKLAAMIGIFANAGKGDVVEIGSLMGRSAFVLLSMARRYGIGSVLTIDPWSAGEAVQTDSPAEFQEMVGDWDFEVLREGFFVNIAPLAVRNHAHLRMTSADAFAIYGSPQALQSPWGDAFQPVRGISVIHIDGNHDYSAVRTDCRLWLQKLLPGSWLVLDDYVWAHGDGPYRVGNQLLARQADRIERAFVCGKALFVRWHEAPVIDFD
jgi:hypothetical protein